MAVAQNSCKNSGQPLIIISIIICIVVQVLVLLPFTSNYYDQSITIPQNNATNEWNNINTSVKCLKFFENNKSIISSINPTKRASIFRHSYPPMLISFGGSGNTFTRLIFEYITRFYTGSMYGAEYKPQRFFDGCQKDVILLKAHGDHNFLWNKIMKGMCPCGCDIKRFAQRYTQNISNINYSINASAMFLFRDPWKAFMALTKYDKRRSKIPQSILDKYPSQWSAGKPQWYINKNNQHQAQMFKKDFKLNVFIQDIQNYVNLYIRNFQLLYKFQSTVANTDDILVLQFEKLMDKNYLFKAMQFLYQKRYFEMNKDLFKQRIYCLFEVMNFDDRFDAIHRGKPNNQQVDADYAYRNVSHDVICNIWNKIINQTNGYMEKFGYWPWNNISCNSQL